jgi:hypothetical protein
MIHLLAPALAVALLAAPAAKAQKPAAPPEQKPPAEARALLGLTADGLAVFELELTANGPPDQLETLRLYSVHDRSGARTALFRKDQQEGSEKAADPGHLWDTAKSIEEGEQWLKAHPLAQADEVNLLADQPGEQAAGGTLSLRKGGKACDATLLFEAPDGAAALVVDACAKGDAALPVVQATVQLVRKDGELVALARVTRSKPNTQEQLASASRLHFVRAPATFLKSSRAGSSSSPRTPPR